MQTLSSVLHCFGDLLQNLSLRLQPVEDTDPATPAAPGSAPEVALDTSPAFFSEEEGEQLDPAEWFLNEPQPLTAERFSELAGSVVSAGGLSAVDRISLAYNRGQQARLIRVGSLRYFEGARCNLTNRCYVVLAGDLVNQPFYTWNLTLHQRSVRTGPGGVFSRAAISHGFNSEAEATAFCLGAGLPGLAPLRE